QVGDLAADLQFDAGHPDPRQPGGAAVDTARVEPRDAELVLRPAGRDLAVRTGIDVRVDAHGDRRLDAARGGDLAQKLEFRLRLNVEAVDALVERIGHFTGGLANPGKDDAVARHADGAGAPQLARSEEHTS